MPTLNDFYSGTLELIFPSRCMLCRTGVLPCIKAMPICQGCEAKMSGNTPPFCLKCSRPLKNVSDSFCKPCRQRKFHFDQVWAALIYDETTRRLLHLFKYSNRTSLRFYLSQVILSFLAIYRVDLSDHQLIIPIPLHRTRLRERGFNQTQLLAELIASQLEVKPLYNALVRIRNTKSQARLSQKASWTNIYGAFKINQPDMVQHKNILLIDDLYTTGSTTSEAARVLREAGAHRVTVLTLAIAISL